MTKATALAAALLFSCGSAQVAIAGAPVAPFFNSLAYSGTVSMFDGSMNMTTVNTTLSASINLGGFDPTLVSFSAMFSTPAQFAGGFMGGNLVSTPISVLTTDDLCDGVSTVSCALPLSFTATGNVGGMFGTTATLSDTSFPPVIQTASITVPASVPEPVSLALVGVGLLGLGLARHIAAA